MYIKIKEKRKKQIKIRSKLGWKIRVTKEFESAQHWNNLEEKVYEIILK